MSPFNLRMLALDRRDDARTYRTAARSYLREGSRAMHRHYMRKALRAWIRYHDLWDDAAQLEAFNDRRIAA